MNEISQVHELVMFDGGRLVTDSRVLAAMFNQRHGNVLRACRRQRYRLASARCPPSW